MKKNKNIFPKLIIVASLCIIVASIGRYIISDSVEHIRVEDLSYDVKTETDSLVSNGVKYKMATVSPNLEEENIDFHAQDTSELEGLVNNLNKTAKKENVLDP